MNEPSENERIASFDRVNLRSLSVANREPVSAHPRGAWSDLAQNGASPKEAEENAQEQLYSSRSRVEFEAVLSEMLSFSEKELDVKVPPFQCHKVSNLGIQAKVSSNIKIKLSQIIEGNEAEVTEASQSKIVDGSTANLFSPRLQLRSSFQFSDKEPRLSEIRSCNGTALHLLSSV